MISAQQAVRFWDGQLAQADQILANTVTAHGLGSVEAVLAGVSRQAIAAGRYLAGIQAATETGVDLSRYWTTVCPECGDEPPDEPSTGDDWHVTDTAGHVLIGCDGYWVVDPNAVGLTDPAWSAVFDGPAGDLRYPFVPAATASVGC